MSSLAVSSSCSPFPNGDTFQHCSAKYLRVSDIARTAQVCRCWNRLLSDQNLWKTLFEREGIPLVSSIHGKERDYRKDFKILYPITISSEIIGQFFGKVIGKVPPISEERFNELEQPDPFESDKLKVENYVFIVVPALIARTVDKETPLALDDSGSLVETSTAEKRELKIPFSLKNIRALCSYPLKGKENMPVFSENSVSEIFEQCGACSDKISVYFMRRHVVNQSIGKPYAYQKKLVKDEGFEVTPLRERVLFNAVAILKDRKCSDDCKPVAYARNPDTVRYGHNVYQSAVGSFNFHIGMNVYYYVHDNDYVGVVPGRSSPEH